MSEVAVQNPVEKKPLIGKSFMNHFSIFGFHFYKNRIGWKIRRKGNKQVTACPSAKLRKIYNLNNSILFLATSVD
jgi:hypothetical protein